MRRPRIRAQLRLLLLGGAAVGVVVSLALAMLILVPQGEVAAQEPPAEGRRGLSPGIEALIRDKPEGVQVTVTEDRIGGETVVSALVLVRQDHPRLQELNDRYDLNLVAPQRSAAAISVEKDCDNPPGLVSTTPGTGQGLTWEEAGLRELGPRMEPDATPGISWWIFQCNFGWEAVGTILVANGPVVYTWMYTDISGSV